MDLLNLITAAQRRGAETFALELHARFERLGVHSSIAALAAGPSGASLPVPVVSPRRPIPLAVVGVRRRMAGADVTIAHGSKTLPLCALAGRPFVYRSIGDPRAWSASGLRHVRVAAFLRRAAGVVALWPGAADALHELHGVSRDRLRVIPNGVDADRFTPASPDEVRRSRRELGVDDGGAVVAYVGALTEEKRVADALLAVAEIDGATLLVAGGGPERPALERLNATLGSPAVFLGAVADVRPILRAATAVVLASRTEGMPAVLIEAGLSGLPVAATAVGGVPDIVDDGVTGHLAPAGAPDALADALRRCVADAPAFGEAARERCAARFDIGVVAGAWLEFVADLRPVWARS